MSNANSKSKYSASISICYISVVGRYYNRRGLSFSVEQPRDGNSREKTKHRLLKL
jgi:hypothetical protein